MVALAARVTGLPAHEAVAALVNDRHAAAALVARAGLHRPEQWAARRRRSRPGGSAAGTGRGCVAARSPHDPRVMAAMSGGSVTGAVAAALAEVAADQAANPAARQVAARAVRLITDRGLSPADAIDEAEAERQRPSRAERGARFPEPLLDDPVRRRDEGPAACPWAWSPTRQPAPRCRSAALARCPLGASPRAGMTSRGSRSQARCPGSR